MMSGHATIETAVESTRIGAQSFLEKPITLQKLLKTVATALAKGAELRRSAQAAALQSASPALPPVPQDRQTFDLNQPLRDARDAFEKAYFEFHLSKEDGSMTRVAEKTGLERTHLYRKLKHLGIDLGRRKGSGVGEASAKAHPTSADATANPDATPASIPDAPD
jgi:DNA-binding NtrC family response regulator